MNFQALETCNEKKSATNGGEKTNQPLKLLPSWQVGSLPLSHQGSPHEVYI